MAAVKKYADWWTALGNELDEAEKARSPLYHYTSMAGLAGILKSKKIWFTNLFHLNDPSELSHGIEIAREVLEHEAKTGSAATKFLCERISETFKNRLQDKILYFIACFSEDYDELGQWRVYADDGRGVALGLAPSLFHGGIRPSNRPDKVPPPKTFYSSRVVYKRSELEQRLLRPIRKAASIVDRENQAGHVTSRDEGWEFLKAMMTNLAAPRLMYCAASKHDAYEREREIRLIMMSPKERIARYVDTRVRGSELVPYVPSPFIGDGSGVVDIVIGPAAPSDAEDAITNLLLSLNMNVPIRRSKIPYRSHSSFR